MSFGFAPLFALSPTTRHGLVGVVQGLQESKIYFREVKFGL
jgi:hypothetical protein